MEGQQKNKSEDLYYDIFIASLVKEINNAPKNHRATIKIIHHKDSKEAMGAKIKSLIDLEHGENWTYRKVINL